MGLVSLLESKDMSDIEAGKGIQTGFSLAFSLRLMAVAGNW